MSWLEQMLSTKAINHIVSMSTTYTIRAMIFAFECTLISSLVQAAPHLSSLGRKIMQRRAQENVSFSQNNAYAIYAWHAALLFAFGTAELVEQLNYQKAHIDQDYAHFFSYS